MKRKAIRLCFLCALVVLVFLAFGWYMYPLPALKEPKRAESLKQFLAKRAVRVTEVDCSAVLRGEPAMLEVAHAKETAGVKDVVVAQTDEHAQLAASSCDSFLEEYSFITDPLTDLERNFPLAFSIVTYKDSAQVVNLLRTIYRPQNSYCIHVDSKSPAAFHATMQAVSRCLPGVFVASRSVNVVWGTYLVQEPEIVCMEDLWKNKTWAYFINLTGQEFPLKTNYELVKILKALDGANDVAGMIPNKGTDRRWRHALPVPYNLTVYKGAVHVALSRGFVDFLLHDTRAQVYWEWCKKTSHASEHYFNTLNYNPQLNAPGTFNVSKNGIPLIKPFISRYKIWRYGGQVCERGKFVRGICILSVKQLPRLQQSRNLFANKFYSDYSRLALACLAEDLFNKTRDEALGIRDFDATGYENMPFQKMRYTFPN